jgi:hypothetical protein
MILGMSIDSLTLLHVALNLSGIGTGLIVLWHVRCAGWTTLFLAATVLTIVTGFLLRLRELSMQSAGRGFQDRRSGQCRP